MKHRFLLVVALVFAISMTQTSCKTGQGCGYEDTGGFQTGKDGKLSNKKGKSNLFSPNQRKRMK